MENARELLEVVKNPNEHMEKTEGFFFGESAHDDEQINEDTEIITKAIGFLAAGDVRDDKQKVWRSVDLPRELVMGRDTEQWSWMRKHEHEQWLKLGGVESRRIIDEDLTLMWEVWAAERGEYPNARFTVERSHISGRRIAKIAYDSYLEAIQAYGAFERDYAIELAKRAFNLNDDQP